MSSTKVDEPAESREPTTIDVVIETPKGSRCKYQLDEKTRELRLKFILPAGAMFPYDFGFIPGTLAEDGDPVDVLVFLDAPTIPGCVVSTRLIGVIEAEQTEGKKTTRNDRLIGVAVESHEHRDVMSLKSINEHLRAELEHFFVSYNEIRGKEFRGLAHKGPKTAARLFQEGLKAAKRERKK